MGDRVHPRAEQRQESASRFAIFNTRPTHDLEYILILTTVPDGIVEGFADVGRKFVSTFVIFTCVSKNRQAIIGFALTDQREAVVE